MPVVILYYNILLLFLTFNPKIKLHNKFIASKWIIFRDNSSEKTFNFSLIMLSKALKESYKEQMGVTSQREASPKHLNKFDRYQLYK